MKLPSLKKLLREDLKDAPEWFDIVIQSFNTLVDAVYFVLNKNVSFQDNISCIIKEIEFYTPADYLTGGFNQINTNNSLKRKIVAVICGQVKLSRTSYQPIKQAVSVDWQELDGVVSINYISGLEASKYYKISLILI